jgi:hypothetical protein
LLRRARSYFCIFMSESVPTSASAVRYLDLKERKKYSAAEVIIWLNKNNFTHAISEDEEIRGCTMFRMSEEGLERKGFTFGGAIDCFSLWKRGVTEEVVRLGPASYDKQ